MKDRLIRVLRWSEKYTKTDMVFLVSGSFYSLITQISYVLAALGLAVMVSHFVSKENYGIYKYILSVITLLSLFSLNSLGPAVFQSAAEGLDGALQKGFLENLRWSGAVFFGALALGIYYFTVGNSLLATCILIGGMFSPFLASASLFANFLAGKRDFYRLAWYTTLDNLIPIILFACVVLINDKPVVLVATYFVTNTLAASFFYLRTISHYRAGMHQHDRKLSSYSKHLSLMGIISGISNNIDQILLFHFVGAAQLAVYNFATALPDQVRAPSKTLDGMLQAQFVRRSGDEIRSGMVNKVLWYVFVCIGITSAYILLAPFLFGFFFPQYVDAIRFSQLYALWILTLSFDPFYNYILARRLVREQYTISLTYSIFQIASIAVGVYFWGILGVIVARILARVVIMIVPYFMYRTAISREIAEEGHQPRTTVV